MSRVLVTGGAGFIGSHLCRHLLERGRSVLCVDNLSSGSESNVAELMPDGRFKFVNHDIANFVCTDDISAIFNLACPASPVQYQKDPVATTRTAVLGTMNMLETARRNNCPMLQASTSEVYGDPHVHPQTEDYWGNVNPVGVRSCYDEGKRCAESLCMDYHRQYGVKVKVIRIFNTYGPRMAFNDGRVVSNFIAQSLNGEPITVYGDGAQTRSFMYVDDLVDAMFRVMRTPDDFTGPVNIGNPCETSVLTLARKIVSMTGSRSEIILRDLPLDDPQRRRPDISLAIRTLGGWQPIVPLEVGLQKTIEYMFSSKQLMFDKVFHKHCHIIMQ